MRKYIKYYNEESKKVERFAATSNITIDTAFFTDRMEIMFINASTGETRLTVGLYVMDKTLEDFCETLKALYLHVLVESAYRKIATDIYKEFLGNDRHTLPVNKVGNDLVLVYNLFLQEMYNEMGKQAKALECDIAKTLKSQKNEP